VYVSVTGRDGRQMAGLQPADFTVLDGGKRQPIVFFSAERHPFAVAFVLDTTFSMVLGSGMVRQVDTARALVEALDPDDQASLGSLGRPLVELSADKINLSRLLRRPWCPGFQYGLRSARPREASPGRCRPCLCMKAAASSSCSQMARAGRAD
jgi:hypothetical protein